MRLTMRTSHHSEPATSNAQYVFGALVVRSAPGGGLLFEFGPADGAPQFDLHLNDTEVSRLSIGLRTVASTGNDVVILSEP